MADEWTEYAQRYQRMNERRQARDWARLAPDQQSYLRRQFGIAPPRKVLRAPPLTRRNKLLVSLGVSGIVVSGSAGAFFGGLIGFLTRPSAPMIGQLPLSTVITRGGDLRGLDAALIPLAKNSFDYVVGGAFFGVLIALMLAAVVTLYVLMKKGDTAVSNSK